MGIPWAVIAAGRDMPVLEQREDMLYPRTIPEGTKDFDSSVNGCLLKHNAGRYLGTSQHFITGISGSLPRGSAERLPDDGYIHRWGR
ncbi:hypothetical protein OOU_Y34scaffold00244g1 [Pyricularia oryzae Y34]|uniref:Uncharacterized protein n=2 Tax=Pyricularia oryzae TaxID=318829 RepID=A0AA97P5B9_PYRO3|nr:hypothetical protein OOU_Y34scaffold00244g1 [Pyricularia oryzae Y34]